MAKSPEEVFRARIAAREEKRRQQEIDENKKAWVEMEQAQLLLPELDQAAAEAVERLQKAGWPDWQGGELRRVPANTGDYQEIAVWRIVSIGTFTTFLGSDGIIYADNEDEHPLVEGIEWATREEVQRLIRHLEKIQE